MRSIIVESAQPALPARTANPRARIDRLAAATSGHLLSALRFLSVFEPEAFDHAMDIAQSKDGLPADNQPGATGEAEPRCGTCGAPIGIFPEHGLDWQHYTGDGTTAGRQQIYDPGHAPVVTWHLLEEWPA